MNKAIEQANKNIGELDSKMAYQDNFKDLIAHAVQPMAQEITRLEQKLERIKVKELEIKLEEK